MCEHFGLGLGSGLELGIGLIRFEVKVRSILFICITVIENLNRIWLPCGILALCCNFCFDIPDFVVFIFDSEPLQTAINSAIVSTFAC